MARAASWTRSLRAGKTSGTGVEAFLSSYGLETAEGVALMGLAEALLRIPDAVTADALIRDTFEGRHWEHYTGLAESWRMSVSSWGLLLTGKMVDFAHHGQGGMMGAVRHLVQRVGEPVIREALRKAMGLIGSQFVLGETLREALHHARPWSKRGYRFSFDILGEGARSDTQAQAFMQSYREGIAHIAQDTDSALPHHARPGMSLKLSALHPCYRLVKREQVFAELWPRLREVLLQAREAGIAVSLDAEEASRLDMEMMLFERVMEESALAGWDGIGFVVQAYQKRAVYVIDWLAGLARQHGRVIPVRLVKGAYWDSEIKAAQVQGLSGYPVFTRKEHTDISYLACAVKLLASRGLFYPQFATHNARTAATILELARREGLGAEQYEFQRLHGMGEALHDMLLHEGVASRIYAPIGAHRDLLAYLIRRLLENGANSSFVHLLMDDARPVEEILADPVKTVMARAELAAELAAQEQGEALPLPEAIYVTRKNSRGVDMGSEAELSAFCGEVAAHARQQPQPPEEISQQELSERVHRAAQAQSAWAARPVAERAALLERVADLLEQQRAALVALCAREGGKTIADGLAEVREAADFCRYYAQNARALWQVQTLCGPVGESNVLTLHARGVFACISPWNFPLAIFTGQIMAALVAGNAAIAKPAEQTTAVAAYAVALFREAGIPHDIVQLVPGAGETIGAALVRHPQVRGVVFTGGTDTARQIAAGLAQRSGPIVPLIAETGGQNCMVVDSSALLERAVDDILLSAFGSAGQRCSALRVLFVQEDIAAPLLGLLADALRELQLGSPLDPATDIGPVIDVQAKQALTAHIDHMRRTARFVAAGKAPEGCFVAPHIFEIASLQELEKEVFGPVLHVVRFRAGQLQQVAEAVNRTGYGLTFGIHSRVPEHIAYLSERVNAGNLYVNRSMIGATVGVQPFGGEGLSGTGPKAGGPHYLLRFATERVLTVNTAALGGTLSLLAPPARPDAG